jgi:hypothetical protein
MHMKSLVRRCARRASRLNTPLICLIKEH